MAGIPREIIKWLQSLDLAKRIKNPKWDLSNGFIIAEIFSWYFPQDIQVFSFYDCDSLELKKRNWFILKNFILKNQITLSMDDVDGTIFCKEGAAIKLLRSMYEYLTNRSIKKPQPERELDYTDYAYQMCLPMHQRSTLSKAIKNNLRLPEILADQNTIRGSWMPSWFSDRTILKSQKIVNDHIEHRREERRLDPKRFGIRPTLGDKCVRRAQYQYKGEVEAGHLTVTSDNPAELHAGKDSSSEKPLSREHSLIFKEIEVKQPKKLEFYRQPIHSY